MDLRGVVFASVQEGSNFNPVRKFIGRHSTHNCLSTHLGSVIFAAAWQTFFLLRVYIFSKPYTLPGIHKGRTLGKIWKGDYKYTSWERKNTAFVLTDTFKREENEGTWVN